MDVGVNVSAPQAAGGAPRSLLRPEQHEKMRRTRKQSVKSHFMPDRGEGKSNIYM